MKRIVLAVLLVVSVFCLAATAAAAKTEAENVTGKVVSVMAADAAKGMKPMITVADNKGEKTVFEVTPTTTLYGADMKPITLDAIKTGASVKVKGTMVKEGTGVATSIRLEK